MTGQTSFELSVAKGMTKLNYIAERLQLSTQIQEAGRRMYQLAVQMNFNSGRPTRFIASACLYIVCRRNRSPHLLIDFSDVLQTPVRNLGQVYMSLVRRLVFADPKNPNPAGSGIVEVPVLDPSIFIDRFSRGLDLGGLQRKVQTTAMRLIQFMHRDWICIGRRPNGLCGAALLIATYFHGFQCSAKRIADVVRMSQHTLRLRLQEMRDTPMASLSRDEFEKANMDNISLQPDEATVPPCMKKRRHREDLAAILDKDREATILLQQKIKAIKDSERLALLDKAAMPPPPLLPIKPGGGKKRGRRIIPEDPPETSSAVEAVANGSALSSSSGSSAAGGGDSAADGGTTGRAQRTKYHAHEPSEDDIEDIVQDIAGQHGIQALLTGDGPGSEAWGQVASKVESLEQGRPAFTSLPLARHASDDGAADATSASGSVDPEDRLEETLSEVDDEELDAYLLDEEERRHKSDIWHEVNKDYLEEWHVRGQEARREARRKQQQHGSASEAGDSVSDTGSASRSRRSHKPSSSSCTQSAMMALAKKVGPSRINIEALEALFE